MINNEKFTRKAIQMIEGAIDHASELGHTYIGSEHLLLSMLDDDISEAAKMLSESGVSYELAEKEIIDMVGRGTPSILNQRFFTTATKHILETAYSAAANTVAKKATPEHILAAIIKNAPRMRGAEISASISEHEGKKYDNRKYDNYRKDYLQSGNR